MAQTVDGEERTFKRDGDEIKAYVAQAGGAGKMPGVVIIPDVHGLSDHYRAVARRFAGEGCTALVLDPYSREGTPVLADLDAIFRWMSALPDQRIIADVGAAIAHLRDLPEVRTESIGVTGFCMGGQYTLMAACTLDGIAAAVSWYGMLRYREKSAHRPASPLDLAPGLRCPYLGLFGADDPIISVADIEELRTILARESKTFEIEIYEGAGHAFFNDTRPEMYRPEVAERAWTRSMEFFRRHLP